MRECSSVTPGCLFHFLGTRCVCLPRRAAHTSAVSVSARDDPYCCAVDPRLRAARRRKHAKRHAELHALRLLRLDRKLSFSHECDFMELQL